MSKNCLYDGTGYVNNVGMSKYWGVTYTTDFKLRVKAGTSNGQQHELNPQFAITEQEAAHVAASYYENSVYAHGLGRIVPSQDGKHKFVVDGLGNLTKQEMTAQDWKRKHCLPVTGGVSEWDNDYIGVIDNLYQAVADDTLDSRFFDAVIGIAQHGRSLR